MSINSSRKFIIIGIIYDQSSRKITFCDLISWREAHSSINDLVIGTYGVIPAPNTKLCTRKGAKNIQRGGGILNRETFGHTCVLHSISDQKYIHLQF